MLTAEDWLSGGYECSTNIWGPREGEQILEQLLETAAIAWTPELEDPEAGGDRFEAFAFPPGDDVAAVVTSDHGTPLPVDAALWWPDTVESVAPLASVARAVGVARFAWRGGDPAVDYPSVVVEREVSADVWEPLRAADGRVASSHDGVVVISYTPAPLGAEEPSEHLYAASWQTTAVEPLLLADPIRPYALQLGRYRLCASGRALAAAGVEDYALCSTPFEVVAAGLSAASSASLQSDGIALSLSLGPAPGLRALRDGVSDGLVPLPGPWTVTVTLDDASSVVAEVVPADGAGVMALSSAQVAAAVSVEVVDPVSG
jgi:neutral ceramidase